MIFTVPLMTVAQEEEGFLELDKRLNIKVPLHSSLLLCPCEDTLLRIAPNGSVLHGSSHLLLCE